MGAVCPAGHASATTDYCDQCGAPIGAAAPVSQPTEVLPAPVELGTSKAVRPEPCPVCAARRSGDDRFCEGCGYDFLVRPAVAAARGVWEAVAAADRAQFERFADAGVAFPSAYVPRRFALDQAVMRIGRSRARPGAAVPELDLAGDPHDPAISRLHAVLERCGDGSYAVRDLGSTNGTTVNDDPAPIPTDAVVGLVDGDRIQLGAWTTITLRRC